MGAIGVARERKASRGRRERSWGAVAFTITSCIYGRLNEPYFLFRVTRRFVGKDDLLRVAL
jgi:hypothetical protein